MILGGLEVVVVGSMVSPWLVVLLTLLEERQLLHHPFQGSPDDRPGSRSSLRSFLLLPVVLPPPALLLLLLRLLPKWCGCCQSWVLLSVCAPLQS